MIFEYLRKTGCTGVYKIILAPLFYFCHLYYFVSNKWKNLFINIPDRGKLFILKGVILMDLCEARETCVALTEELSFLEV